MKKQLKTITRDVEPCLPEEGFLVKPCKSLLMAQDNNYLKLDKHMQTIFAIHIFPKDRFHKIK